MMKEQVKEMYDQITMPEETQDRIRKAMQQGKAPKQSPWKRFGSTAAAMAAMLTLVLVLSPTARAAVDDVVRYVFGTATITVDTENGNILSVVSYPAEGTENPVFVEVKGGVEDRKMYFSYEGQYVDITDKTSMETPYIHKYVDEENIEHIIIIGGEPDNFGVSEFYRQTGEDLQPWQGWEGGYSENYIDNETGKAYPWLAKAWEELNLPWPLPGA